MRRGIEDGENHRKAVAFQLKRLQKGMHPDGAGLYLHVNKDGARSWIFRYMRHSRPREMGLGPLHTVSLRDDLVRLRARRRAACDGTRRGRRQPYLTRS